MGSFADVVGDGVKCKILDTILVEGGNISSWLYTDRRGYVAKVGGEKSSWKHVLQEFTPSTAGGSTASDWGSPNTKDNNIQNSTYPSTLDLQSLPCAIIHKSNGEQTLVDYREFSRLCETQFPPDVACVQKFLPPRGANLMTDENLTKRNSDVMVGTYFYRYSFGSSSLNSESATSLPQTSCFKAGVSSSVNGVGTRGGIMKTFGGGSVPCVRCLHQPLNKEMSNMSSSIVRRCEMESGCRVIELDFEFLLDENQTLWLVRTTGCVTAESDKISRGKDQERSHLERMERATKADVEMQKVARRARHRRRPNDEDRSKGKKNVENYNPDSNDDISWVPDFSHGGVAGSRSENRARLREGRIRVPDEDLVELIMNEEDPEEASRRRREQVKKKKEEQQQREKTEHDTPLSTKNLDSLVSTSVTAPNVLAHKAPSTEYGRSQYEINVMSSSKVAAETLGSTQLGGCPGDFCGIKVNIDKALEGVTKDYNNLSEFRRKLLEAEGEEYSNVMRKGRRRSKKMKGGKSTDVNEDGEDDDNSPCNTVPLKSIVQARHERHLVDVMLRRHANRESGPYCEALSDMSMGAAFPGHFYKHSRVCENCYRVYSLVDVHRTRAIKQIEANSGLKPSGKLTTLKSALSELKRPNTIETMSPTKKSLDLFAALTKKSNESVGAIQDARPTISAENEKSLFQPDNRQLEEVKGMRRAYEAIANLGKSDIAELRSFVNPPPAVLMVSSVLMIILKGRPLPWSDAKKIMSNGDRFLNLLLDFDPDSLTTSQLMMLRPYEANPSFHPDAVAPVCLCAAKFLSWCIGMMNAYRWKRGEAHNRLDPLETSKFLPKIAFSASVVGNNESDFADKMERRKMLREKMEYNKNDEASRPFTSPSKLKATSDQNLSAVWAEIEKSKRQRAERARRMGTKLKSTETLEVGFGRTMSNHNNFEVAMTNSKPMSPSFSPVKMPVSKAAFGVDSISQYQQSFVSQSLDLSTNHNQSLTGWSAINTQESTGTPQRVLTKKEKEARKKAQRHQMERLAARPNEGGETEPNGSRGFLCEDGETRMTYAVIGQLSMEVKSANFVVVHDIFDTHPASGMAFKKLSVKYQGSQFLVFNYPGQADTTYPTLSAAEKSHGGSGQTLTAEWQADRLHELLQHVECCGEMLLSSPFHLIGFGHGSLIASSFAVKYGKHESYRRSLRSLVSINGFSSVDSQLAAIIHSSVNVFKAFPQNRPDLPVAFFTQFLFSEEYLQRVDKNLALNIYTAVSNPITLNGRLKLCKGLLNSRDVSGQIAKLQIPTVVLQSTDNLLVNASNVDPFLDSRAANHLWSHEIKMENPESRSCYGSRGVQLLTETLGRPYGAFVAWTKGGHELRQENKRVVVDLLDTLAMTISGVDDGIKPSNITNASQMHLNQGYDGTQMHEKGSLVPSQDFIRTVNINNQRSEAEKEEEERLQKKKEEEENMTFEQVLNEGKMSEREIIEKAEKDRIEEEEHMLRFEERKKEEELKKRMESETSVLFAATTDAQKIQRDIEKKMNETLDEISAAPKEILSGDDLLAKLQKESDEIESSVVSAVQTIAAEAEEKSKELVDDAKKQTDLRVKAAAYVTPNTNPPLTVDEVLEKKLSERDRQSAEDAAKFDRVPINQPVTPAVPGGKPKFPDVVEVKSEETIELRPDVQKEFDDFKIQEAKRKEVENEFNRSVSLQQKKKIEKASKLEEFSSVIDLEPANNKDENDKANPEEDKKKEKDVATTQAPISIPSLEVSSLENDDFTSINDLFEAPTNPVAPLAARVNVELQPGLFNNLDSNAVLTEDNRIDRNFLSKDQQLRSADDILRQEASTDDKFSQFKEQLERKRKEADKAAADMIEQIKLEQERRRKQYELEDAALLNQLERDKDKARVERANEDLQRRLELQKADEKLVKSGLVDRFTPENSTASIGIDGVTKPTDENVKNKILEMPPTLLEEQPDLPENMKVNVQRTDEILEKLAEDQKKAEEMGIMRVEDYHNVQRQMASQALERDLKLRSMDQSEQQILFNEMALKIQNNYRGRLSRAKSKEVREKAKRVVEEAKAALKIQKTMRGYLCKKKIKFIREMEISQLVLGGSAILIQKMYRGHKGRCIARNRRRYMATCFCQRVYRGHLGRCAAQHERDKLAAVRLQVTSATKIQSVWKMRVAREEYRMIRVHTLASAEIQRVYRGRIGRKKALRKKKWEAAEPGPERLKMGLALIEESKVAFERQQEEIDALNRAQSAAEARISHVHAELKESEGELTVLERELQEIDQIEVDLHELTHERNLLQMGIEGAAGLPLTGDPEPDEGTLNGRGSMSIATGDSGLSMQARREQHRQKQTEAYALEMAVHIKRAEREKKKQELEAEFSSVFADVELKKKQLDRLEVALADMEATRLRKDREFSRLQSNLMELLEEQKYELDALRSKGIELETATATSAAAATATAMRAKEHEKQSAAMFTQQEELMKFQFMSMSLSYFSSLNMLKNMREINSDTTAAAISSTADAAAAAAAASAAANIPNVKGLKMGANELVNASIKQKRDELTAAEKAQEDAKISKANPFPKDVRFWSVEDVARWLDTLALQQYKMAFKEASVDGEFLMELREQDLQQVLGMEHKLHVRKIILARDKLRPLSEREHQMKQTVEREEKSEKISKGIDVPPLDTVFSQARNGRLRRMEESLNAGFPVDAEDEKGNTLLLIAAQNRMKKMIELLLARAANINHQNGHGNTALHYAMAYDPEGVIGEFLIEKGADDTLENINGNSCYDGLE